MNRTIWINCSDTILVISQKQPFPLREVSECIFKLSLANSTALPPKVPLTQLENMQWAKLEYLDKVERMTGGKAIHKSKPHEVLDESQILCSEIDERKAWLDEMVKLNQGAKYQTAIMREIQERETKLAKIK
jgi:hypothetical protein